MYQRAGLFSSRAALTTFRAGVWHDLSFEELRNAARQLSNYLIDSGIECGDKVAIISESGAEFGIVFFATVRAGAILVPLDPKLSVDELVPILNDCSPRLIFASTLSAQTASKAALLCSSAIDIIGIGSDSDLPNINSVSLADDKIGHERRLDETALVVYTSGSSGDAKGVMITFDNLIFQAERAEHLYQSSQQDVFLSILPMNHLFEFVVGFLGALYAGSHICYLPSLFPDEIVQAIRAQNATYMVVVPAFLRLFKNTLERQSKGAAIDLQTILGSQFRGFICGGAPLSASVQAFFEERRVRVFLGYGMTEASPIITTNTHDEVRQDSVGKPLPGVEVRIERDGEICTRGRHVMQGYYNQPQWTSTAIDSDGWLHTGDIGHFDGDGFLYITGRKKDLIVLPGGKKVQPEEVESILATCSSVKEVCVLACRKADTDEEVVAVVVPSGETFNETELQTELSQIWLKLAAYKRPARTIIWRAPLPRTHTMKLKRSEVQRMLSSCEVFTS
jgi:long-chain acyl-CoA synthetase